MAVLSLTCGELEELDNFLLSGATSSSIMALDTLHGFLTAVALGDPESQPDRWLAHIWNNSDAPMAGRSASRRTARMASLITRIYLDIIAALDEPDAPFLPLVMTRTHRGRTYPDGEMWCYGFLQGMTFGSRDWAPFLALPTAGTLLRPIRILGSKQLAAGDEALASTPPQRAGLTARIPAIVEAIARHLESLRPPLPEAPPQVVPGKAPPSLH